MKTVILCGGYGTRLSQETRIKPKPMVKIGNIPILQHIMNIYSKHGFDNFILALGYKGYFIKKYFKNKNNNLKLVDTGINTLTGGRLLRLKKFFKEGENFMLTYGDGLSNQNLKKLLKFHLKHKKIATMTVVRTPVRFGEVKLKGNLVSSFKEKPQSSTAWINGGFFVFNYKIFDFIKNDKTMLEREPMEKLQKIKKLYGYKHTGFWQCMDTLRDKNYLNKLYKNNKLVWLKKK
jgi:glucose-1-phosphate cytidylyltransferase|tara:strand:+ start:40 stop:741 length:702 start_codon:yes stop_codon:yes gene_type:complete